MPTTAWQAPATIPGDAQGYRVGAIVAALSQALDLSTGQPPGHSIRTSILGMRIAGELGLPKAEQNDLYYALLLKDCGCSGNASATFHALRSDDLKAKRDVKTTDWTRIGWESVRYAIDHVAVGRPFLERVRTFLSLAANQKKHTKLVTQIRCERGATMARLMGLSEGTADAILNLDEHWDGQGNPEHRRRQEIPVTSQLMLLAQTLENYSHDQSVEVAIEVVEKRSKTWFNPELVRAAVSCHKRGKFWGGLANEQSLATALAMEPEWRQLDAGHSTLDSICQAFAQIVDAKSPFTYNHSNGVANAAVTIAVNLGLPAERVMFVRHAALLHDLGKLGVSNAILEKPGKLDDEEWVSMKMHPFYTWKITGTVPGFEELSEVAASHHEKLDGSGYFRNLQADQLSLEARILTVADIFDALAADRPYREGMPLEKVFGILRKDAGKALDGSCVEALAQAEVGSDQTYRDLDALQRQISAYGEKSRLAGRVETQVKTSDRQ